MINWDALDKWVIDTLDELILNKSLTEIKGLDGKGLLYLPKGGEDEYKFFISYLVGEAYDDRALMNNFSYFVDLMRIQGLPFYKNPVLYELGNHSALSTADEEFIKEYENILESKEIKMLGLNTELQKNLLKLALESNEYQMVKFYLEKNYVKEELLKEVIFELAEE
jgi:hypothetical protein